MIIFGLIVVGLFALVSGAELLICGANRIAVRLGVSSLVIGLTIVAFGTSAPELTVSVLSSLKGHPDMALGNVVGSNILNVLLILGISSLLAPLVVDRKLVRSDVPIMIFVSILAYVMSFDGRISRLEGILLTLGLLGFIGLQIFETRRGSLPREPDSEALPKIDLESRNALSVSKRSNHLLLSVGLIGSGLVLMVLGSTWLVDGATRLTLALGVSELVISLTIIACGTSLPELATSVVAALRGEEEIAVGNIVGSNIFNLLGVLGISSAVSSRGIAVSEHAVSFDIPIMVAVAIFCWPCFRSGYVISRPEGGILLACYVVFLVFLV